jgi:hypothetical protein
MTAVGLALASALAFASSTVIQHRAATSAPSTSGRGAALRLAGQLVRDRGWLAGQAAAAAGLLLHGLALRSGQVVVVQPVLSSGLVFSLALGAWIDRRHPDRPLPDGGQWAAAGLVVTGLTVFLLAADPRGGTATGRPGVLLSSVVTVLALAGLAALWSRRATAPHLSLVLGGIAGFGFGITGLLLKDVVGLPATRWLLSWPLYALLVVGAVSVVSAQWAYRAGTLIASLPAMTVLEPLVAIGLASPAFAERLAPGALAHLGQALGVVMLTGGVFLLARRTARRSTAPKPAPGRRRARPSRR